MTNLNPHPNPSDGPKAAKVSVIIPVYNERPYIEEILRRVQTVNIEKEIIVVDDCSGDGTREWLLNLQEQQVAGICEAPTLDGHARLGIDNVCFLFQQKNQEKAQLCAAALQKQPARLCWSRMQILNTTSGLSEVVGANLGWAKVPVSYAGRTYAEGKKINWRDGLQALWQILRYNLFD